jgi:hypothetical protein
VQEPENTGESWVAQMRGLSMTGAVLDVVVHCISGVDMSKRPASSTSRPGLFRLALTWCRWSTGDGVRLDNIEY